MNREFQLELAQFLQSRTVYANGRHRGTGKPMRGQRYVLDTVRSMYQWAADVDRGNLIPSGFSNLFRRSKSVGRGSTRGISEPDITVDMAAGLISICDEYQLPVFTMMTLYGLRPGELGWIFVEDVGDDWLRVVGHPELSYQTKGRCDKQFPMLDCLRLVLPNSGKSSQPGLLFRRRHRGQHDLTISTSKQILTERFQIACEEQGVRTAAPQRRIRDKVLQEAGQLSYDSVRTKFRQLAQQLHWPKTATLKDFRHLFATGLENGGVPESYRRFLMGHAPGHAAIVTYTHLNKLREHFLRAMDSEFGPVIQAIERRAAELKLPSSGKDSRS